VSGWHRADIFRSALAAAAPPRALDQVEGLTIGLMRCYFPSKMNSRTSLIALSRFGAIASRPDDFSQGLRFVYVLEFGDAEIGRIAT
jgi:hypothetical protein